MKNTILFFCLVLIQIACCKHAGTTNATVHEHCTGTYLKIEDKEYFVCNYKQLNGASNGSKVKVSYEITTECTGEDDRMHCMMLYEHDGYIRIKSIEK